MSRIDEALARIQTGDKSAAAVPPEQSVFESAWSAAHDEPARAQAGSPAVSHRRLDESNRVPESSPGILSLSSAWRERLASGPDSHPGLVEQFRRLAGTLYQARKANGIRSVMITSATPGDGKTLTAVNLALVLAESYRAKVLLVDADLRRPSIPTTADLGDGAGLSEALRSPTERKLALVALTPRLTLLPAGQAIPNSIEALTSPRMRMILEEAVERFDWVILDAPPIGPATDARLLTDMVGGTLFVVHAGRTQYDDIEKGIDTLGRDNILGVVLNGVDAKPDVGYYGVPR